MAAIDQWIEVLREHYDERAAIMEHDGGLTRAEAEAQARASAGLLARNKGAPWAALRAALGDASLPNTNEPVDALPYGLPDWCVDPAGRPTRQGAYKRQKKS